MFEKITKGLTLLLDNFFESINMTYESGGSLVDYSIPIEHYSPKALIVRNIEEICKIEGKKIPCHQIFGILTKPVHINEEKCNYIKKEIIERNFKP